MPLSEHEQHLLEQMEQALYAEDPKFASQMQGSTVRDRLRRHITIGILAVLAGLVLVVLGVVNEAVWLGAIGFALMVGGAAYAVTPPRTPATHPRCGRPRRHGAGPRPGQGHGHQKQSEEQEPEAPPERRFGWLHAADGTALGQAPGRRLPLNHPPQTAAVAEPAAVRAPGPIPGTAVPVGTAPALR